MSGGYEVPVVVQGRQLYFVSIGEWPVGTISSTKVKAVLVCPVTSEKC